MLTKLKALGHEAAEHKQGDAHSIAIDLKTNTRTGATDKRLDRKALGE